METTVTSFGLSSGPWRLCSKPLVDAVCFSQGGCVFEREPGIFQPFIVLLRPVLLEGMVTLDLTLGAAAVGEGGPFYIRFWSRTLWRRALGSERELDDRSWNVRR